MSTDTAVNTSPAPSEALSPAELAYFNSGGTDTSGLGAEFSESLGEPPARSKTVDPEDKTEEPDEFDDDEIVVGADGKARGADGKFVPLGALHKERTRRKTLEAENLTYREKMARADERLAVLNEVMGKPDAPEAQKGAPQAQQTGKSALEEDDIDPEIDPFGAVKQQQRRNAEMKTMLAERRQAEEAKTTTEGIRGAYQKDAVAFMEKAPDFRDAYAHLVGNMHRELELMGVGDAAVRDRMIAEKEKDFVAAALNSKKSPAEMIYNLAKTRGFSGKQPEPPDPPKEVTPEARIENIRRGQDVSLSVSRAGGSSGEGLTLESLANMDEAAFADAIKRLGKSKTRALLGG